MRIQRVTVSLQTRCSHRHRADSETKKQKKKQTNMKKKQKNQKKNENKKNLKKQFEKSGATAARPHHDTTVDNLAIRPFGLRVAASSRWQPDHGRISEFHPVRCEPATEQQAALCTRDVCNFDCLQTTSRKRPR